jgi:hypothetical protein
MPKGFKNAIEALDIERRTYKEKIQALEDERDHFKKEVSGEIGVCQLRITELNQAIAKLGGRAAAGTGGNGKRSGQSTGTGKSPAKCNNGKSSWWCYMKCPKNKDRSCKVIKFRKQKAA